MTRRRSSGDKSRKSFSLSKENAQWLERQHENNQSAFVDKMVEAARDGNLRAGLAGKKAQLQMLRQELKRRQQEIERIENEIESVEADIEEMERNPPDQLEEAFDIVEQVAPKSSDMVEDNPAVENHAEKLGMSPEQLVEEYRERRGELPTSTAGVGRA